MIARLAMFETSNQRQQKQATLLRLLLVHQSMTAATRAAEHLQVTSTTFARVWVVANQRFARAWVAAPEWTQ
jgi:hypothetical protein